MIEIAPVKVVQIIFQARDDKAGRCGPSAEIESFVRQSVA